MREPINMDYIYDLVQNNPESQTLQRLLLQDNSIISPRFISNKVYEQDRAIINNYFDIYIVTTESSAQRIKQILESREPEEAYNQYIRGKPDEEEITN